jgi:hypothetical protein
MGLINRIKKQIDKFGLTEENLVLMTYIHQSWQTQSLRSGKETGKINLKWIKGKV